MASETTSAVTAEVNQSTRSHEMVNKDQLYRFTDDNTEQFDVRTTLALACPGRF